VDHAPNARVALYSHDSMGLGHVRRNLLIAGELSRHGHDVLLVSGSPEATAMVRPPATDLVTLPALRKNGVGRYEPRHLRMGLNELLSMRRELLSSALEAFAPDLFIVDRHARGFLGELEPALERLTSARTVLGLRDVLDAPERVGKEWLCTHTAEALEAWYDEVWLYGDAAVHQPLRAAGVASPVPVVSTGYLIADRPVAPTQQRPLPGDGPFVLCMVGGGSDGEHLATQVLDAPLHESLQLLIVTGPQMASSARDRLDSRARGRSEVTIVDYVHDPAPLLREARAAIVMGGYNTICEVLSSETPALVVPRDHPRLEQTMRAEALSSAGSFDVLATGRANGARIGAWLTEAIGAPRRSRLAVDVQGLQRIAERSSALLAHDDLGRGSRRRPAEAGPPLALIGNDPEPGVTRAVI
jgi:predicted glycosyltransferase